jgi:hypothetical protein
MSPQHSHSWSTGPNVLSRLADARLTLRSADKGKDKGPCSGQSLLRGCQRAQSSPLLTRVLWCFPCEQLRQTQRPWQEFAWPDRMCPSLHKSPAFTRFTSRISSKHHAGVSRIRPQTMIIPGTCGCLVREQGLTMRQLRYERVLGKIFACPGGVVLATSG